MCQAKLNYVKHFHRITTVLADVVVALTLVFNVNSLCREIVPLQQSIHCIRGKAKTVHFWTLPCTPVLLTLRLCDRIEFSVKTKALYHTLLPFALRTVRWIRFDFMCNIDEMFYLLYCFWHIFKVAFFNIVKYPAIIGLVFVSIGCIGNHFSTSSRFKNFFTGMIVTGSASLLLSAILLLGRGY